jgi:uncharacterized protein (DUF111 family)
LRILLGTAADTTDNLQTEHISILETCIDDMNPEFFGFLMERLYADGALDVYWIPVHMKKNRPGTLVQVLCREDRKDALIQRLLSETTSLGVRYYQAARRMLAREQVTVHTSFGEVRMKRVTDPGGGRRLVPEYDVCREIALRRNIPLRSVYETIAKEAAEINISDKR